MTVWLRCAAGTARAVRTAGLTGVLALMLGACSGAPQSPDALAGLAADAPSASGPALRTDGPVARPLTTPVSATGPAVTPVAATPAPSATASLVVPPASSGVSGGQTVAALTSRGGSARLAELTQTRCDAALTQASEAVHRYRSLPAEEIVRRSWAEEALRASDLAQRACDMAPDQAATALMLRATALYLHGQYSRAALYLEQVPEQTLPAPLPRSGAFSTAAAVRQCHTHRPDLDDLRLGILLQQAGFRQEAGGHLKRASRSVCAPLARLAEALRQI